MGWGIIRNIHFYKTQNRIKKRKRRDKTCLNNLNADAFKGQNQTFDLPKFKQKLLKMKKNQIDRNDQMFAGLMRRESVSTQSITNISAEEKAKQDKHAWRLK